MSKNNNNNLSQGSNQNQNNTENHKYQGKNNKNRENRSNNKSGLGIGNKKDQIEELENHVFDCGGKDSEQFEKTTRCLADYVGTKYGGCMQYVIENHKTKTIKYPDDLPSSTTRTETLIYEAEIKRIVEKNE